MKGNEAKGREQGLHKFSLLLSPSPITQSHKVITTQVVDIAMILLNPWNSSGGRLVEGTMSICPIPLQKPRTVIHGGLMKVWDRSFFHSSLKCAIIASACVYVCMRVYVCACVCMAVLCVELLKTLGIKKKK